MIRSHYFQMMLEISFAVLHSYIIMFLAWHYTQIMKNMKWTAVLKYKYEIEMCMVV